MHFQALFGDNNSTLLISVESVVLYELYSTSHQQFSSRYLQAELSGVALVTAVFKISSVVACRCPQAIIRGVVTNILKGW